MKRIRFIGCTVVLILFVALLLFGCGKVDVSGIYKLENTPNHELTFQKDGKGFLDSRPFDYSVKGHTILIMSTVGNTEGTISGKIITFKPSNNTFSSFFSGKWIKQ